MKRTMAMYEDQVTLKLSRQEALVLFDWLAERNGREKLHSYDDAQQQVLWTIEGQLEKTLTEVLAPDYKDILTRAKQALLGEAAKE